MVIHTNQTHCHLGRQNFIMNNNKKDAQFLVTMDSKSLPVEKEGAIAGVKLDEDEVPEGNYFKEGTTLDLKSPTLEKLAQMKVDAIPGEREYFNDLIDEIWKAMPTPMKMSLLM